MSSLLDLKTKIENHLETITSLSKELRKAPEQTAVETLRVRWLGKKGIMAAFYQEMAEVNPEERREIGKCLNDFRERVEAEIAALQKASEDYEIQKKLELPYLDLSLPTPSHKGSLHPISLTRNLLLRIFKKYGFTQFDAPEIEFDYYNFSALNIPLDHPARDMHDTFFIEDRPNMVLRTHTSNNQIHAMLSEKPPFRLIAPGKCYRVDNDPTHTPMFHQLECVVVGEGIHMGHLKGIVDAFVKSLFGADAHTRLRPSYFPFVEPGAEVDMACAMCKGKGCRTCKHTGWIEIGGSGMIHPNVLEGVGIDSETYSGFAFGFGIDRMAMLIYEQNDLRLFFEGDQEYQNQFVSLPISYKNQNLGH